MCNACHLQEAYHANKGVHQLDLNILNGQRPSQHHSQHCKQGAHITLKRGGKTRGSAPAMSFHRACRVTIKDADLMMAFSQVLL